MSRRVAVTGLLVAGAIGCVEPPPQLLIGSWQGDRAAPDGVVPSAELAEDGSYTLTAFEGPGAFRYSGQGRYRVVGGSIEYEAAGGGAWSQTWAGDGQHLSLRAYRATGPHDGVVGTWFGEHRAKLSDGWIRFEWRRLTVGPDGHLPDTGAPLPGSDPYTTRAAWRPAKDPDRWLFRFAGSDGETEFALLDDALVDVATILVRAHP